MFLSKDKNRHFNLKIFFIFIILTLVNESFANDSWAPDKNSKPSSVDIIMSNHPLYPTDKQITRPGDSEALGSQQLLDAIRSPQIINNSNPGSSSSNTNPKSDFDIFKYCRSDGKKDINTALKNMPNEKGADLCSNQSSRWMNFLSEIKRLQQNKNLIEKSQMKEKVIPIINSLNSLIVEASDSNNEILANDIASIQGNDRVIECRDRGENADLYCCEGSSPQAKEVRNLIGGLLPLLSGVSAKVACSKYQKGITVIGGLMTTWNMTCAGFKAKCENACQDAKKSVEDLHLKLKSLNQKVVSLRGQFENLGRLVSEFSTKMSEKDDETNSFPNKSLLKNLSDEIIALQRSADTIFNTSDKCDRFASALLSPIQSRFNMCTAWGKDMAASLVGIGGLIMQAKQKSKCGPGEEPNTCNTSAPTAATCAAFCADAANKSNPACRCILNPLASGCMDGSNSGYANGGGAGKYNTMNFNKPGAMGPGADPTTNPAPEFGGPSSGNGGGGPSGRGGGGGGLGGGGSVLGSSSKPAGGAAGKAGSRIDPNVISGFEGGGGASGSKGGGGYGAGSNSALIDKLKSELKTKADKLRGLASEDDPRLQITGAGGKTNWEKISDRYRDMTGQMIKDD